LIKNVIEKHSIPIILIKHGVLIHIYSGIDVKGTVVNPAFILVYGGSHEITVTVHLIVNYSDNPKTME